MKSKFITERRPAVCVMCLHFKNGSCIAFQKGIPNVILNGDFDHSKPLPSQGNNIVFEPIK